MVSLRWITKTALLLVIAIVPELAEAACPAPRVRSSERRSITPLDLATLRDVGSPDSSAVDMPSPLALSPDGKRVAFTISQGNPASNDYCRQLIVVTIDGNAPPSILDEGGDFVMVTANVRGLRVAVGSAATVTPSWSPDGKTIGFLRRDRGVTQLWAVDAAGGRPRQLTRSAVDIERWAWVSKDRVVVASRPDQIVERSRQEQEGRVGWLYDSRFSPAYAAFPQTSGALPWRFEAVDLTTGEAHRASIDETTALEAHGVGEGTSDLSITNASGKAWVQADDDAPASPLRLYWSSEGKTARKCPTNACADGIVRLYWSSSGNLIYLRREGWAKSELAFYRWLPGQARPRRLWSTRDLLLGCLPAGVNFVCLRETSTLPRRIVELDPETGRTTTLFDPNPEFASLVLGPVQRLRWRNDRGLAAWGDLVLPNDRKAGKKLPLIVVQYHSDGFLRGGTGDEYPIFALAARGFAVLSIENPAPVALGLPGIRTWAELNRAGMKNWAERRSLLSSMLTGVAQAISRGIADPARIGITGVSDGATSARFALINSRVFAAAAISSSSIEPKTSMTYGGIAWAEFNRALGYPAASTDDPLFWKSASIALNARTIDVPILIQASDDEYLLALESFTALREQEQPVEMFVFPDEHHIKWQPAHRLATYQRAIDWFDFWLRDVTDPDPRKADQYARWRAMRDRRAASSGREAAIATP